MSVEPWATRLWAPGDHAWHDRGTRYDADTLRAIHCGMAPLLGRLHGKRVAITAKQDLHAALLTAALDGCARAVYLCPPDTDDQVAAAHCGQGAIDIAVGDRALPGIETLSFQPQPAGHGDPPFPDHDTTWLLGTSGTTGTPRLVTHSRKGLTSHARPGRSDLAWGLLYAPQRFAGLQVVLQALVSATDLVFVDRQAPIASQVQELASVPCTALSATPTLWRRILQTPGAERLPLRQVTLGGEVADAGVLAALAARYADARIIHIYASTEAGVGFSVRDGQAGFPASYVDEGTAGVKLRVHDGRLWLRPSMATDAADQDGWVDSGDLVERRGDRYVFLGRASGAINVGGNKVMPEEVEAVLLSHADVQLAKVTGRASSQVGQLVEATVMPRTGADTAVLRKELQTLCKERLERFKVPAFIRFDDDMQVGSAGKLVRRAQ